MINYCSVKVIEVIDEPRSLGSRNLAPIRVNKGDLAHSSHVNRGFAWIWAVIFENIPPGDFRFAIFPWLNPRNIHAVFVHFNFLNERVDPEIIIIRNC